MAEPSKGVWTIAASNCRRVSKAGIYELDEGAPRKIARGIEGLENEPSAVASGERAADPISVERAIPRREELTTELRRALRALREAIAWLSEPSRAQAA